LALGGLSHLGTSQAKGEDVVISYLVNTIEAGTPDADLGDGKCSTTTDGTTCSLRAAIEQANRIPADLAAQVRVDVDPSFAGGTIEMSGDPTTFMVPSSTDIAPLNTQAYFWINRTMTVDLADKIHITTKALGGAAAFWVNKPNVQLLNFTDIYSSETSIVFGPDSDGSRLDGGESIEPSGYEPVNMLRIRPGADNITIANYKMGLFPHYSGDGEGMLLVTAKDDPAGSPAAPVKNLTISHVVFDDTPSVPESPSDPTPLPCDEFSAAGCDGEPIRFAGGVRVEGLVIEWCTFIHMEEDRSALDFLSAGRGSNWVIANNTFTDARSGTATTEQAAYHPVIQMPAETALSGTNSISANTFDNSMAPGKQGFAIIWAGPYSTGGNTNNSNLSIEGNSFDGYEFSAIMLMNTGTVTVRKNKFGTASASQTDTVKEETIGGNYGPDVKTLLLNYNNTANRRILPWRPTRADPTSDCKFKVGAAPPESMAGYGVAGTPITLDFYYTADRTAEVFLESVSPITSYGAITATLPTLPDKPGQIRIQTQGTVVNGQMESSQFSRTFPYAGPGRCNTTVVDVTLGAWQGLDPAEDDLTHDAIFASPDAVKIEAGTTLMEGEPVWFTYTVTNPGWFPLTDVVVRDDDEELVCTIARIERDATEGCVRRLDHIAPGTRAPAP
jgi:adhesin/invasin